MRPVFVSAQVIKTNITRHRNRVRNSSSSGPRICLRRFEISHPESRGAKYSGYAAPKPLGSKHLGGNREANSPPRPCASKRVDASTHPLAKPSLPILHKSHTKKIRKCENEKNEKNSFVHVRQKLKGSDPDTTVWDNCSRRLVTREHSWNSTITTLESEYP